MLQTRPTSTAAQMHPDERAARVQLAACYRIFALLGRTEMIYNHITLRLPGSVSGEEKHFLINPFGLHYNEVTASNLVKVNLAGDILDGSPHPINPAGYVLHSTIHGGIDGAHCVMHTHTTAGVAVACKQHGLRHDNFYSAMLWGQVAYHDFEGITTDGREQPRLVRSLGDKDVLILRNHGLLVCGPHVPCTFMLMWTLQRACEVQMAADAAPGANVPVPQSVLERIPEQRKPMGVPGVREGQLAFDAILRRAGIRHADLV